MLVLAAALGSGTLFGIGLVVSQMIESAPLCQRHRLAAQEHGRTIPLEDSRPSLLASFTPADVLHGNHWRSTFSGWRLAEYAIRICNRSLTKKRALSIQLRDPHDCDNVPHIGHLLFCLFVAGPHEVLFGRERLPFLLDQ